MKVSEAIEKLTKKRDDALHFQKLYKPGDENFLVCERELADELYKKGLLPHGVKVIVPNRPRTGLVTVYDLSGAFGTKSLRTKSSGELLWNMICARKSNRVEGTVEEA